MIPLLRNVYFLSLLRQMSTKYPLYSMLRYCVTKTRAKDEMLQNIRPGGMIQVRN